MYRVRAKEREGRSGFRRSGIFFSPDAWTELSAEQLTDEIRNEPQLIVERSADVPAADEPGAVIGRLQRENTALTQERDDARAKAETYFLDGQHLRNENAALVSERDAAVKAQAAAEKQLQPHKEQVTKLKGKVSELEAELAAAKAPKE